MMVVPKKSVLITDLDNTLFDWVGIWHASFSAMLEELIAVSGVPREQLIREFKAIHQKHRTSEYAFSIEELPSLRKINPSDDLKVVYDSAIRRFRQERKRTLKLYPGVMDTLRLIKSRGSLIVGYTESMAFYSMFRVRRLQLDGVLDFLYSPQDHELPSDITPEQVRTLAGVAVTRDLRFHLFGYSTPAALILVGVSLVAWAAFYGMDKIWYHRLLVGSVKQGAYIEKRMRYLYPEMGLTKAIGKESPWKIGKWTLHSDHKINLFYILIGVVLLGISAGFLFDVHADVPPQ